MNIEEIKKSGFTLNSGEYANVNNVAFLSLRNSLRNFFSTYSNVRYQLGKIERKDASKLDLDEEDVLYNYSYIDNACSAITSFHHFVELIIKDILFKENPLLSFDTEDKHDIFYDLLFQKQIDEATFQNLKQIEFSKAFSRLRALIKSNRIDSTKYRFIDEYDSFLQLLNFLRNRIIHRGVFVLTYSALDTFFGKYALPFLNEIVHLEEYSKNHWWKFRALAVKLDPIEQIINEYKNKKVNIGKIAFLKELGRAAYNNPLQYSIKDYYGGYDFFNKEIVEKAELISKHITKYGDSETQCPVCNANTLVLYEDTAEIYNDDGDEIDSVNFVFKLECQCCSLEVNAEIGDIKEMGLAVPDYWQP